MHWLLIITMHLNGQSAQLPWALTIDAESCAITGAAVTLLMQMQVPGLVAAFDCMPEVSA